MLKKNMVDECWPKRRKFLNKPLKILYNLNLSSKSLKKNNKIDRNPSKTNIWQSTNPTFMHHEGPLFAQTTCIDVSRTASPSKIMSRADWSARPDRSPDKRMHSFAAVAYQFYRRSENTANHTPIADGEKATKIGDASPHTKMCRRNFAKCLCVFGKGWTENSWLAGSDKGRVHLWAKITTKNDRSRRGRALEPRDFFGIYESNGNIEMEKSLHSFVDFCAIRK